MHELRKVRDINLCDIFSCSSVGKRNCHKLSRGLHYSSFHKATCSRQLANSLHVLTSPDFPHNTTNSVIKVYITNLPSEHRPNTADISVRILLSESGLPFSRRSAKVDKKSGIYLKSKLECNGDKQCRYP